MPPQSAPGEVKLSKCPNCDLTFSTGKARRRHTQSAHPKCPRCFKRQTDLGSLRAHQKRLGHFYCDECEIGFDTPEEHKIHARDTQHDQEYLCCDCGCEYGDRDSLKLHCCECDKVWGRAKLLKRHLRNVHGPQVQAKRVEPEENLRFRCNICKAKFSKKGQLNQHKQKHKTVPCPVGDKCGKKFISATGLFSHLESGHCKDGMTRAKLNALVVAHDEDRHITDAVSFQEALPSNQISPDITPEPSISAEDNFTDEWSDIGGVALSPSLGHSPSMAHSEASWSLLNGTPGEEESRVEATSRLGTTESSAIIIPERRCHLCPPTRKPFLSLRALEDHMRSATHAPAIFHCPLSFVHTVSPTSRPKKQKYFKSLSGLAAHMENGACQGGSSVFKSAMEYIERKLWSFGFANIKLVAGE